MTTELSMSMFASRADYDAAVRAQVEQLPNGLKLADSILSESDRISEAIDCARDAIRAEHQQRVTFQHHAADLAHRIATLEAERELATDATDRAVASGYQGFDAPEAGHWLLGAHKAGKRIADLEAERDEVEEDRDELRNERDKHIARIAKLETKVDTVKRLHDVAVDERDELRAKAAEIEGLEPVAWEVTFHATRHRKELSVLSRLEHGRDVAPHDYAVTGSYSAKPLYTRPVHAIPDGQQTHTSYRHDYPVREDVLGLEIELARADEKLFGVGFLVNGWHVPARLVSAFRPVPAIRSGCGTCGDACKSRQPCRLADESPEMIPTTACALEFRRDQYGLDQRQWAWVLGMQPSHYSEVVAGKRTLPKSAMALAFAYGVPAVALFQRLPNLGAADIDRRLTQMSAAAPEAAK